MWTLTSQSPAKINVFLRVKHKRPDGYHELESIFLPLAKPLDRLTIKPAARLEVVVEGAQVPGNEANICWKAAERFAAKTGLKPAWRIEIIKNIPVAAGLGGGSGNAAAVLKMLREKYQTPTEQELFALARNLGADVPFFLNPTPTLVRGIGDELTALEVRGKPMVLLIAPSFPVSTAWAYGNLDRNPNPPPPPPATLERQLAALRQALAIGRWSDCGNLLYNDFAPALFNKFPLLDQIRTFLDREKIGPGGLSGSGPALFSIVRDRQQAEEGAKKIRHKFGAAVQCFVSGLLQAKRQGKTGNRVPTPGFTN